MRDIYIPLFDSHRPVINVLFIVVVVVVVITVGID